MTAEAAIGRLVVQFPGGFAGRFRWAGSGDGKAVFDISESTGSLTDYSSLFEPVGKRACRAELRIEGPTGSWTARFASVVYDEPQGVLWDVHGLLVVKYGFRVYAFVSRTGELAWSHATGTPILAILASSRLDHVLLQTEVETIALRADGEVAWRAAHSDVITDAQLVAGRLVLTTYAGQQLVLDAQSGQAA